VRGGIMDQFTCLNTKEGTAFILDCRTSKKHPQFSDVVLPKQVAILIANTNVKHELVGSPYNERRESCERAVKFIQEYLSHPDSSIHHAYEKEVRAAAKKKGVTHLRDVSFDLLRFAADHTAMDARAYRRAVHVVTEDVRTIQTGEALIRGDVKTAGRLLNEGHASLRDDYQVSCEELDIMVEIAQSCDGVYGARMMGGGFGGCAIVLVHPDKVKPVTAKLEAEYKKRAKRDATIIPSRAGKGGHVVKLGSAKSK
jgi:galactokinase